MRAQRKLPLNKGGDEKAIKPRVCVCVCAADVWHLDLFIGTGSGTESNPIKPGSTTPTTNLHTHTHGSRDNTCGTFLTCVM